MTSTIDALNNIISGLPPVKADTQNNLTEAEIKKEQYRTHLKRGIWMVEFTKVDGTPSVMECTLDPRYFPPQEAKDTSKDTGSKAAENPTVLRVYALDRASWRSFKVLNVTKFYQKPKEF